MSAFNITKLGTAAEGCKIITTSDNPLVIKCAFPIDHFLFRGKFDVSLPGSGTFLISCDKGAEKGLPLFRGSEDDYNGSKVAFDPDLCSASVYSGLSVYVCNICKGSVPGSMSYT